MKIKKGTLRSWFIKILAIAIVLAMILSALIVIFRP